MDIVLPVLAVGVLGIGGYYLLFSKGGKEAAGTVGGFLKNVTDAINSTGEFIGSGSYKLQQGAGSIGETVGNVGCHIQRGFGILGSPFGIKPLECRGAGSWTKKEDRIIALHMLTASPKPYPKITNNVYNTLVRMGANPAVI